MAQATRTRTQDGGETELYEVATTVPAQSALIAKLLELQQSTQDMVVQGRNLYPFSGEQIDPKRDPFIRNTADGKSYGVTPFAHTQLAERSDIPLQFYRRVLARHPELWAQMVKQLMWVDRKDDSFLVRSIGGNIRALLSNRAKILDSYDLFFHVFKVADEVGAKIWKMSLSETKFYMELVHPNWALNIDDGAPQGPHSITNIDRSDGGWHVPGLIVGNSDVGRGALTVTPRIIRWACNNGTLAGDALRRVHLGSEMPAGIISPKTKALESELVWSEVEDVVRATFDLDIFKEMVKNYASGRDIKVTNVEASIDQVVKDTTMTDKYRNTLMKAFIEGGDVSTFGLMQAVTQAAQLLGDLDQQYSLERYAHNVLTSESEQRRLATV